VRSIGTVSSRFSYILRFLQAVLRIIRRKVVRSMAHKDPSDIAFNNPSQKRESTRMDSFSLRANSRAQAEYLSILWGYASFSSIAKDSFVLWKGGASVPGPLQHVAYYTSTLILQNSPILHNVPPVEVMSPYPKQRKCEMFLCNESISNRIMTSLQSTISMTFISVTNNCNHQSGEIWSYVGKFLNLPDLAGWFSSHPLNCNQRCFDIFLWSIDPRNVI